jgi:hypothetical protein
MKRLIIILLLILLVSCSSNKPYVMTAEEKSAEQKWIAEEQRFAQDERYCLDKSGKLTGFWAANPMGLIINFSGANRRYDTCMKELGW